MKRIFLVLLVFVFAIPLYTFAEESGMLETVMPVNEADITSAVGVADTSSETGCGGNDAPNPAAPSPDVKEEADQTSELPTVNPTVEPEISPELPTVQPSPEVSEQPTLQPEVTEEPTFTPEATLSPEEIEGWLLDGDGNKLVPGRLEDLLATEGELKVAVSTAEVIEISEFPVARLREIAFIPDAECFPGTDWRVVLARGERLRDEYRAEEIEAAQVGELQPLFIWVREDLPESTEDPNELQMIVHAENLMTGEWSNIPPVFTMESVGEGSENCEYAVIILDERIAMLSGNTYAPEEEGVYTVRLALMNEMGDIMDRSEKYTLWLDWSAPELMVEVSMEEDRTMHIYAGDRVSGVAGLSLDGGATWNEIGDVFSYTAPEKQSFAPGMIQVLDNAGNITAYNSEIVLKKIPSYGGGSGSVSKDHAAGDGDTASYSAYTLEIPKGEMTALTIGGEEIDLQLLLVGKEREAVLPFTAELQRWTGNGTKTGQGPNTLVLHGNALELESVVWKINGAVLRKLYNSDIAYLVLERDGELISLPTIGFTAGTRYAELKMMGAATQEFDYEIHMTLLEKALDAPRPGFNQSRRLLPAIWVEVDGERCQMLDRESTPEMYFYDVYCAPEDLMDYPYGAYPGTKLDERAG